MGDRPAAQDAELILALAAALRAAEAALAAERAKSSRLQAIIEDRYTYPADSDDMSGPRQDTDRAALRAAVSSRSGATDE